MKNIRLDELAAVIIMVAALATAIQWIITP